VSRLLNVFFGVTHRGFKMATNPTHNTSVVQDNESAVARSLGDGNFVQAYLLIHALTESLLRAVLGQEDDRLSFNDLVNAYRMFLDQNNYPTSKFVDELVQFDRRRNRIVDQLWRKGFTVTNDHTELAARAGVMMYGLLIEWLSTFHDSIAQKGFNLSE
jgi:hypothetical protein